MNRVNIYFIEPYYVFYWNENTGEVKIKSKNKYISIYKNNNGYLTSKVLNKHLVIHQFIGEKMFGNKKQGYCINHKDCNKTNNSRSNLEYITVSENIKHAIKNGFHPASDARRNGRYIDGRATKKRIKEYKHEWYIKNKKI